MRLLVIGGGAREHALVRALARPGRRLWCIPGNPGIARLATVPDGVGLDADALVRFAGDERIDLTVVGPEAPLAAGLADRFRAAGLRIVGPTRAAAALETSKVFAKAFMTRHGIPTADYRVCDSAEAARRTIDEAPFGFPVVVKADGLAAGKGVVVAADRAEAMAAVEEMMVARRFGDAGARVIIERCLEGTELSFFVLCDGTAAVPIGSAQDHKRLLDGDRGPNTGGMGAFAPSPLVTPALEARILREIVEPVVAGLARERLDYRGVLYCGLMLTADGPRVLEFNVRLGDPEAQVVLPLVETDLLELLIAVAEGRLASVRPAVGTAPHVGVVLASAGYPGAVDTGHPIEGLEAAERRDGVLVFHGGTALRDGRLVTGGGRVLTVVGRGATFREAIDRAYGAVATIAFAGMHYRTDIGRRALAEEAARPAV
ncbi:MAG TPA: phosphoribosylamine--glycine ligase [Vicinamibacterales bacterium]|nr:phosphoribosylamine--glycine ligase [Vicinamibacterales bacterium]